MENLWKGMPYLRHLRGLEEVITIRTVESDHYCWAWDRGGVATSILEKRPGRAEVINHTFK